MKLANFLFEIGSLRKLARSHRQKLLTDDFSDNIASHSFRVTHIGYLLAKLQKADPYKVIMMCLFHDVGEARTGDINRTQKKYVTVDEEKVIHDQLYNLTEDNEVIQIIEEYNKRESIESSLAKDADKIDQMLLVKEYAQQGVAIDQYRFKTKDIAVDWCVTQAGKTLMAEIYDTDPYDRRYSLDK